MLTETVSKIGEKIQVGDYARYSLDGPGLIEVYIHFNGKVGTMVQLETSDDKVAASEAVKRRLKKFVLFEHTFGKKDKLCRTFKVSRAPRLMALDPHEEKLSKAKLGTFSGRKTVERLAAWLKKYETKAEK